MGRLLKTMNNDLFRIYVITLKKDNDYVLKVGITSKTIDERVKRKHLAGFHNGLPMTKWFEGYKVEFDSGKLFDRHTAQTIEQKVLSKYPRDYYTPYGKWNMVDGITETRRYTVERKETIINTLKTLIKTYGSGGNSIETIVENV